MTQPSIFSRVSVLGGGSWGTVLADLACQADLDSVTLITRSKEQAEKLSSTKINEHYIPGFKFSSSLTITSDLSPLQESHIILFVIPSASFKKTLQTLPEIPKTSVLVTCTKGLDPQSNQRMSELLQENFPQNPIAVLSGPNHAKEVSQRFPTCTVIATQSYQLSKQLQNLFSQPYFRIYTSYDLVGVEMSGVIKNVLAIGAGVIKGLNLGDNAMAAFITRALAEITRIGIKLGGKTDTFQGLSGLGDLITTCTSEHSRNFQVGLKIAKGYSLEQVQNQLQMVAEGINNTKTVYQLALQHQLQCPLVQSIYKILYQNYPVRSAVQELLARPLKSEIEMS